MTEEKKMTEEEKIELFKELLKRYTEMYNEGGLVGVSEEYLHIDNETFDEFFSTGRVQIEITEDYKRKQGIKDGITFISLFPLEETKKEEQ